MGTAPTWRQSVIESLADLPIVIANPRRDDWDSTWRQSINEPRLREQVLWELKAMECARVIAVYFVPETQAPISLMELGLHANSGRMLVCCPDGFYRKGNVEIVAFRYGVPLFEQLDPFVSELRERLQST